jgi:hypothetical protein
MQMRDDLGITTKLENGKAYLEFALPEKIGRLLSALQIEIWEGAEGERLVFHGEYSSEEADSMTALLLFLRSPVMKSLYPPSPGSVKQAQ